MTAFRRRPGLTAQGWPGLNVTASLRLEATAAKVFGERIRHCGSRERILSLRRDRGIVGVGLIPGKLGNVVESDVGNGGRVGRAEADEGGRDHDEEPNDDGDTT